MNRFRKQVATGLGVAALLVLSVLPVAAADDARVRVLHASPDAPAVDIYVNDAIVDGWSNVPFATISDYVSVPAGEYNIKVYATGTTSDPVIDADVTLDAGMSYTVAAINPLASIEPAVFADEPDLDYDNALVRVVHLSPDAPAVDVAPDGADPVVSNLEFPDATDYLALPAGTYDLEVRLAGESTVALQLDPLDLQAGRAYSVFAIGSAAQQAVGGNSLSALMAVDGRLLPDSSTADELAAGGAASFGLAAAVLMGLATFVLVFGRGRLATQRR